MRFSKSWLNVHTSITEGWGISIIESSSSGTPTVAYKVLGVSESLSNGRNGFVVDDNDREALKNAALSILKDHIRWSKQAYEYSTQFSWDKTAESWMKLIIKIGYTN